MVFWAPSAAPELVGCVFARPRRMIVPCKDLPAMADFMYTKSSWRPADLLAVYWVRPQTRVE